MTSKIPKIIHFCWFGNNKKPKLVRKCISSWEKYLDDYRLIEWNEENFDFFNCPFARRAYEAKKYAFVADYVRACVLYEYGGIYMDTDMEVLRKFDNSILNPGAFAGCEKIGLISAGIIGTSPRHFWIREVKEYYNKTPFVKENGTLDLTPIPTILTSISKGLGFIDSNDHQYLKGDIHIYPIDYFYPKSYETNVLILTANTITIHHFAGSWMPLKEKIMNKVRQPLKRMGIYQSVYPIEKKILRFAKSMRRKFRL
jgi:hypothetical protein